MARVKLSRRWRRAPRSRSGRPARRRSRSDEGGTGADAGAERGTVMERYRARGTISVKTLTSSPSAVWPWHLAKRPARRGQKTSKTSCGCRRSNLKQQRKERDKTLRIREKGTQPLPTYNIPEKEQTQNPTYRAMGNGSPSTSRCRQPSWMRYLRAASDG